MSPVAALVAARDLAAELAGDAPPVLVDVRWNLAGPPGVDAYLEGHLPGAHFVDLDTELAGPPGPAGRHPLPATALVAAALRRCGVSAGSRVVCYDAREGFAAARAWWVFRYLGLRDVRLLDGGFAAWRAAGLPVTPDRPADGAGDFVPAPGGMALLDAPGAADTARTGVLLDARSPERYRGEVEPIDPVAGHIPGAVCAPTTDNLRPDGTFRSPGELAARFAALGVRRGAPVATYCGSGVTAAHQAFALHVAGVDAAVYIGSWSEWVADPSRPVARGDGSAGGRRPGGGVGP